MIELSPQVKPIEKSSESARRLLLRVLGASITIAGCGSSSMTSPAPTPAPTPASANTGEITVSGNHLFRDGVIWAPHGVVSIAFVAPPAAQQGDFKAAYNHFNTAEVAAMKTWPLAPMPKWSWCSRNSTRLQSADQMAWRSPTTRHASKAWIPISPSRSSWRFEIAFNSPLR